MKGLINRAKFITKWYCVLQNFGGQYSGEELYDDFSECFIT
jgi:hypothetical protein